MENKIRLGLSSDSMFKLIFGNEKHKEFTAWLFNNIQDQIKIKAEDVVFMQSKEKIGGGYFEGEMDIKFKVENNIYVDVEMQMYNPTTYDLIERLDTYSSSLKLSSLKQGDKYRKRNTYVICFCKKNVIDNEECILSKKSLLADKEILKHHNIIVIQLKNYENCGNIMVRNLLELMLTENINLYKGKDKTMDKIIEAIMDYNCDEDLMYDLLKKDIDAKFRKYELEAIKQEGKLEGKQEGIQEGRYRLLLEQIQNKLNKNKTVEEIAVDLDITVEEVNKYIN